MSLAFSHSRKSSGVSAIAIAAIIIVLAILAVVTLGNVSASATEETPVDSPITEVEVVPLTEPDPDPEVDPDPVPEESKKVFVCKYVGTPDVDEVLQTGDNPISVSVNAIEQNGWDGNIPGYFSDQQGRSLVIAYDTGQDPEPACPGQDVEVTPPAPVWTDPCGPNNGYWSYTSTDEYTYSVKNVNGALVITVEAEDGFFIPEGTTDRWSQTDSGEPCPPDDVEVTPPAPVWTDPCGPLNGFWTFTDTEAYKYRVEEMRENGLSVVIAFANDGFFFPEGAPFTWDETDSGKPCPPDEPILAKTGADAGVPNLLLPIGILAVLAGAAAIVVDRLRRRKLA